MAYIGHRNSAAPRSCDKYRPFFSFLYLSQGLNIWSYIPYIGLLFLPYITIQEYFLLPYITIFRYRGKKKKLYKGYRSFFRVPVTNIGMKKMAYIGHRNEAQPSSCGQYRPFFEFLYLSQGREKNPISYIVVFLFQKKNSPILRYSYFLQFL